ncbi:MAG: ABC transporter permease [Hyphomicrobiaceae bacterium]
MGGRTRALEQFGPRASLRRIWAMVLRYWYVIRSSWPRIAELIYWPLVQMLMWGLMQRHLAETTNYYAKAAGLLIGAVLLWDILVRGQLGFSVSFLEEIWSRNLGHLLMSPLRPWELVAALMLVSLIRLAIALVPVAVLAYLFFGFNLLVLGFAFAAFFANLMLTAWALGLVATGAVLRYGLGAEGFAWLVVFVLLPVACVYYPVATLPAWLQPVALALPPTHVFEGMRSLLAAQVFDAWSMVVALLLNAIYLSAGAMIFAQMLRSARANGTLVQLGE